MKPHGNDYRQRQKDEVFALLDKNDFVGLFKMTGKKLPLGPLFFIVEEFRDRVRVSCSIPSFYTI